MFICLICNKEFKFESGYNRHKNRKIKCSINNTTLECQYCNKNFLRRSHKLDHDKTNKHINNYNKYIQNNVNGDNIAGDKINNILNLTLNINSLKNTNLETVRRTMISDISNNLYEFSCKRVCEYIVLLSILLELKKYNKNNIIEKIEDIYRKKPLKSVSFNETFMTEYGSNTFPVPKLFYIPGDRLWFKNMDDKSSDVAAFEGKWAIYLGNGLFGDFWKTSGNITNQFTFEDILIEIYNWRYCVKLDDNNESYIDEVEVYKRIKYCKENEKEKNRIINIMNNYYDNIDEVKVTNNYYKQSLIEGSIDKIREKPKNIKVFETMNL